MLDRPNNSDFVRGASVERAGWQQYDVTGTVDVLIRGQFRTHRQHTGRSQDAPQPTAAPQPPASSQPPSQSESAAAPEATSVAGSGAVVVTSTAPLDRAAVAAAVEEAGYALA